ncbi:MAG: histidine kinase dimerization/phospho-acceptor domain-containing protein [Planctomycetota bacterium]
MFWIGLIAGATLAALALLPLSVMRATRQRARALAAERRALAAERMAEIGAMTGGLAHEIKNPLSTIGLNAQLLAEAVEDLDTEEDSQQVQGRLLRRVDVLRREAERLRDILGDFLRFAGAMRLDLVPTDLNTVVEELVDFYLPQAEHHGIRLTFDPGQGPMVALIDEPHLKLALLILLF